MARTQWKSNTLYGTTLDLVADVPNLPLFFRTEWIYDTPVHNYLLYPNPPKIPEWSPI